MLSYGTKNSSNDFDLTICLLLLTVTVTEVLFGIHMANPVSLALIYVFGVLIISYITSGYHFGIASALILSFLYHNYDPVEQIIFKNQKSFLLGIMIVTSVSASVLISTLKSKAEISGQRADKSNLIYEINQKLQTASDLDEIIKCALDYAKQQIDHDIVFYTEDPQNVGSGVFSNATSELNTKIQRNNAHEYFVNPETGPTPFSDYTEFFYYPVRMDNNIIILMGIYFEYNSISKNDILFVRDLMSHVGVAAELQSVLHMKHKADIESEREKVRNTLLRSISHDLRTPLTGILGESTLIADHADNLDIEDIKIYAKDIQENSQWLIRLVENLLIVTRITGDTVNIKKIDGDVEEIVAQAISIIRKRYPKCNINADAASNPIYIHMDATLMTQVIINLLDNAVKYSPEKAPIKLKLKVSAKHVCISILDEGPGMPENYLSGKNDAIPSEIKRTDSKSGFGLGLTICNTIVKAHGGSILIKKNNNTGTVVSVYLPL